MTDSGHKVLNGFVRLSYGDQREVVEGINRFLAATAEERSQLMEELQAAVMGPIGTGCPCCGPPDKNR
jgi:hypothetical protein